MHYITTKTILTSSGGKGTNIYRGCQHGCIYCDTRSKCYHFDHEFTDIAVKENAPQLLENEISKKRKKCMIGTGSMCDPYIPLEKELCLTRKCLEILDKHNFGATLITKSDLVMRDIDILNNINRKSKAVLQMTLTTFDDKLCKIIEPNVVPSSKRFETLCNFNKEGIPSVVWLSPILPFINDTRSNLDGIMDYCIRAKVKGIICFGFGLTLREGNREYFYEQLDKSFPGLKEQYIKKFGLSYYIGSSNNDSLFRRFKELCDKYKIMSNPDEVFNYLNTYEEKKVTPKNWLFDE